MTSTARTEPARTEPSLRDLLKARFGFSSFRPHQEAVCQTVADGNDALLVMPTGAGKSLCYQLPALARGGTALVISPLIALMEDQVQKLCAQGFRAERIHSGRSRESSRAACVSYLKGELDYLFFAPERLGVPGFPEMLAKKTPALIAVDEAHCISQWGHDFRPEYRMLGERLPKLRPAPILALTATATPRVQDDIITQLRLVEPRRLIHGFRRTNINMEIVEAPKKGRHELAAKVLEDPGSRPAILYAPSRKEADEVAAKFSAEGLSCAAYHAGMTPAARSGVQRAFLSGDLEVIVATIAFGMGIDKADVRSVIHLAMPGSVEAYSQEVGRAGRDGKMSRAVLLCAWSDRRTHEFFLERDYPEAKTLARLFAALDDDKRHQEDVRRGLHMNEETFAAALDKLWVHGGVIIDNDQALRRGTDAWRKPYEAQRAHRQEQLELMFRFANGSRCRVLSLLDHFGDKDGVGPCGICDVCAPERAALHTVREPSEAEGAILEAIVHTLAAAPRDGMSTGKLWLAAGEARKVERRTFDRMLKSLCRAGIIDLEDTSFLKDNQRIVFTKARLLKRPSGPLQVADGDEQAERRRGSKTTRRKKRMEQTLPADAPAPRAEQVEALRAFRLQVARQKRIPAFRVLTDQALMAIAASRPTTVEELLQVRGIGNKFIQSYGADVLAVLAS